MNTYCYLWQAELSEEHCEAIKCLYAEGKPKEAAISNVASIDKSIRSSNILPCGFDTENGVYLNRIINNFMNV